MKTLNVGELKSSELRRSKCYKIHILSDVQLISDICNNLKKKWYSVKENKYISLTKGLEKRVKTMRGAEALCAVHLQPDLWSTSSSQIMQVHQEMGRSYQALLNNGFEKEEIKRHQENHEPVAHHKQQHNGTRGDLHSPFLVTNRYQKIVRCCSFWYCLGDASCLAKYEATCHTKNIYIFF